MADQVAAPRLSIDTSKEAAQTLLRHLQSISYAAVTPELVAAAPRLTGAWQLDTKRSDSIEPFLKLVSAHVTPHTQIGVPWVVRKLAGNAAMSLEVEQSEAEFKVHRVTSFREQREAHHWGEVRPRASASAPG
jgi:hypothetical protein